MKIHFNSSLETLEQSVDHVALSFSHRDTSTIDHLSVEWVLGCDGAASPVREMNGIKRKDWGFEQDWLVIDLLPSDECMAMLNSCVKH